MATKKVSTKAAAKTAVPKASAAPALTAQPGSAQQAAVQAEIYLATDDAWSTRYWNDNDLHAMERKLFG
jgi:hypothetical protein